ncbi:hypothetical protein RBWH47_05371 [Rhodopirellula baltica WH47]|uniref:Uncharacterized protein n=1 Tax=Rhodopirellula baltica WH47 TaxID=991778 RepID=F2AZ03_RHOBT|nr:hypothetical protein RBWH47_05371 [Rhodopirellula baltica WH47]
METPAPSVWRTPAHSEKHFFNKQKRINIYYRRRIWDIIPQL